MNRETTLSVLLAVVVLLSTFAFAASASSASITAEPDTPGDTSTHTVVAEVGSDAGGSSWNGLEVDYQNTDQNDDISEVGQTDIARIGIDEDDDGTIETDTSDDVSSVTSSNNGETLGITLGGSYDIEDGDHVIVEYEDAQNPSAGDYQIEFTVNPQSGQDTSTGTLSISESTPTPTETSTPTPTPSETETSTPTPTPTSTETSTPTPTPSETETSTSTSTPTPTETETSSTSTETSTPTPTESESDSSWDGGGGGGGSADTATPTATATATATPTPENPEVGEGIADAGAVTVETTTQPIYDLRVNETEPGQNEVDVYINVTSLEAAGFDLDSLNARVNDSDVNNATHVDQNVNQNDGNTTVRLTFDVDEGQTAFTVDTVWLTQLGPGNAEPTENLRHDIAVSDQERLGDEAPNGNDATTDSYSVLSEQDAGAGDVMNPDFNEDTETEESSDDGATAFIVLTTVALLATALLARRRL